jgi:hypothetical protein
MSVPPWDPEELKRLAHVSGRPLEVKCAGAFARAGWRPVYLSTYFVDAVTEKTRELDVLVEYFRPVSRSPGSDVRTSVGVRGLVSVKGFSEDQTPVGYAVENQALVPSASLITTRLGREHPGPFPADVAARASRFITESSALRDASPLVAMDVYSKSRQSQPSRKRDSDLYEGLDSAIKAALFWSDTDLRTGRAHAVINVPILVLAQPFWNIELQAESLKAPELRSAGYHLGRFAFPSFQRTTTVTVNVLSLVWSIDKLPELLTLLHDLADWLLTEIPRLEL